MKLKNLFIAIIILAAHPLSYAAAPKKLTLHQQFMTAVSKHKFDEAEKLLKSDDNYAINIGDKIKGIPVLLYAIRNEEADALAKEIIEQAGKRKDRPAIINAKSDENETALMEAISKNKEYLPDLLKLNPDVFPQAKDGSTALMLAIVNNNNDLAMDLLGRGASLKVGGRSLAEFARQENARKRIEAFRNMLNKKLFDAIDHVSDTKEVNNLIQLGADVNYLDPEDNVTSLMKAVYEKNEKIVQALLNAKADVNAKNTIGNSAFSSAFTQFMSYRTYYPPAYDIMMLLIKAGANVNVAIRSHGGSPTPLILASEEGLRNIVEILLEAGANVNDQDTLGRTALDWAQDPAIIDLLTKHGAKHAAELGKK